MTIGLGVVAPLLLIAVILGADAAEGPKTAYVGVLAVVPMLAAVFATPGLTALVAVITWLAAFAFGTVASDGNVAAQRVRLIIIALSGLAAIGASVLRERRERQLQAAMRDAEAADALREQAETDLLTGLLNRRGLVSSLAAEDGRAARTVALIDCDGLKAINDELGHLAGDEYLRAIGRRLARNLAAPDHVARWGGDEFLVVQSLPLGAAEKSLRRMHSAATATPISIDGTMVDGTMCVGICEWQPGISFEQAIAAADGALYEAKAGGRNRIVVR
jgi:diguanylate cyclase (GGDEF)-like protein